VCNRDGGERCNHGLPWHSLGIPPDRAAASFKAQMQPHGTYNAHNRYLQWRSKQLEALWLFNGAIRCSTVGCDANFPGCESGACSRPSRQASRSTVLHWLDNVRCCCRYAGVVIIDSCTTSHGPDIKTALDTRAYPAAKVEIEHPPHLFQLPNPIVGRPITYIPPFSASWTYLLLLDLPAQLLPTRRPHHPRCSSVSTPSHSCFS